MLPLLITEQMEANSTTSSTTSSTQSTTSSSSSSASRSSMTARQSSINASRQSMQRAQLNSARQNATRSQQLQGTKQRGVQKSRTTSQQQLKSSSSYHPMVPVRSTYHEGLPYYMQYQITGYYNNLLFYQMITGHKYHHDSQLQKKMSIESQKQILKKYVKDGEKLYTVTIKGNNDQERLIVLTKEEYEKVQQGQSVRYHQGHIEVTQ
ncbi:hypothetical protein MUA48_04720 [Staphylococcus sp. IVB6238]|uniref:hypothetical protein n=1 Tax=Staphylococcus sp. IVB6238 TaxID=2989770 RepID=UPI0021CFD2A3|nr:hypothetical protein [Staphylococcus sp. IVB6238]UXR74754.1 hypothetical protein MUA48_04720 [Staphylococcus sp. IVB6238]